MPHAPVRAHIHQPFDIHRHFPAQVTLDRDGGNLGAQAICVVLRKVVYLGVPANTSVIADLLCCDSAYSINRRQSDCDMLVGW
jgi:hypothetical protein